MEQCELGMSRLMFTHWLVKTLLFALLGVCLPGGGNAATGRPDIVVNSGHAIDVIGAAISLDHKILVTSGVDKTVRIWEFPTGRLLRVIPDVGVNVELKPTHNPDIFIASGDSSGNVVVINIHSSYPVFVLRGHKSFAWHADVSSDGKYLVSGSPDSVNLWDLNTGALIRTFDQPGGNFVGFLPGNKKIAVLGVDATVRVWELGSKQLIGTIKFTRGTSFGFAPGASTFASYGPDKKLKIWDLNSLKSAVSLEYDLADGVPIFQNASIIASVDSSGGLQVRNGKSGKVLWQARSKVLLPSSTQSFGFLELTSDDKYLSYAVSSSTITILGEDGSSVCTTPAPLGVPVKAMFSDLSRIFLVIAGKVIECDPTIKQVRTVFGLMGGNMRRDASTRDPIFAEFIQSEFSNYGNEYYDRTIAERVSKRLAERAVASFSDDGHIAVMTSSHSISAWDVTVNPVRLLTEHEAKADFPHHVSPNGKYFAYIDKDDRSVTLWNIVANRATQLSTNVGFARFATKFSRNSDLFAVAADGYIDLYETESGRVTRRVATGDREVDTIGLSEDGNIAAIHGQTSQVIDLQTGNAFAALQPSPWPPEHFIFSRDKSLVLSMIPVVQIWESQTGKLLISSVPLSGSEWISITPEGFFSASQNGAKMVNVVRDLQAYSVDQFYDALHRPDLVREKLSGDTRGLVREAANKMDLTTVVASGPAPAVAIVAPSNLKTVTDDVLTVEASLVDRGGGIGRVEWRVNGVTLGLTPASDFQGVRGRVQLSRTLPLQPGENRVSIISYNGQGLIASDPAELVIVRESAGNLIPRLYVLAVGVNDYWDSRLRLAFAVADARALGEVLQKAGENLYERVYVTTALDADGTAANLDRTFTELGRKVRPQDVFVFFMSGHGKTVDGRFYFIPQDFRYTGEDSIVTKGIGQDQLQQWLARIPARKSVLLFDACESGSLTLDEPSRRGMEEMTAIDRLTRAMGRTTLTATTDDKPAAEGMKGHGVFTYALLLALREAQADNEGLIEVAELASYVDRKVPELSYEAWRLRQVPQMKIVGSNFPIARRLTGLALDDQIVAIPTKPTHVVITAATVHETASTSTPVVVQLKPGALIRILNLSGNWALIARDGMKLGYVDRDELATLQ
jgi:WD40 repeat protein